MAAVEAESLHIAMFPWSAFGHMLPFFELAKSLATKGHRISFVSTPRNINRLPKIPPHLASLFTFTHFHLPHLDDLPVDAEATTDLPLQKVEFLKKAYDGLESPLGEFLESSSPDWIIYDFVPHWLPPLAAKHGVSRVYFSIFNAAFLSFFGPPSVYLGGRYEGSRATPDGFTIPPKWIPFDNNLFFRYYEITKMLQSVYENVSGVTDGFRFGSTIHGSDLVAVRSCTEIEPEYLKLLQENIFEKVVIPIGLLPPRIETNDKWADHLEIKDWLDIQEANSVVYVAFGSEAVLSQEETTELALGLELSELPFFWVLRTPVGSTESILPEGFEDRVKGRGFVSRSWAPQLKILSHRSTGGFLTHSGWSSVIESLSLGCPLILLPLINDQAIVARLLEWKKIAFEVPRDESDGSFTRESVAASIKKLIVGDEGESYRSTVKQLKEVVGDTTRQDRYIDDFAQYLKENRHKNKRQTGEKE